MKKLVKILLLIVLMITCYAEISAQAFKLLPEKKGSFKITYWKLNSKDFSIADINAYLKNISAIPEIVQKNPVLANPLGFDCEVDVHSEENVGEYGHEKVNKVGYGFPSVINFHFLFFFLNDKGKEVRFNIEPPHWDVLVNRLAPFANGGPLTRNGDLFFVSTKKEIVAPGIDRYDDDKIFLYNPDRPPYLVPVTIKEVFTEMIDYYKNDPDKIAAEYTLKILYDEYALYSESEKNDYAYLGGRGPIPLSNVNNVKSDQQVLRVNPKYWNKNLPRSAVQTLAFVCNKDSNFYERELKEQFKTGSVEYYITRMVKELEIKSLQSVIER